MFLYRVKLLFVMVISTVVLSGCMMVDSKETRPSWHSPGCGKERFVWAPAPIKPTWYSSGIVDEHQRAFIELIRGARWQGLPVNQACLVSDTQVITYKEGRLCQRPKGDPEPTSLCAECEGKRKPANDD